MGLGFRVIGVWGLGVWGLGFRVLGLGGLGAALLCPWTRSSILESRHATDVARGVHTFAQTPQPPTLNSATKPF